MGLSGSLFFSYSISGRAILPVLHALERATGRVGWMARIAGELKAKAIELGIDGPYTSWWHMFGWNTFGVLFLGPAIATKRFFDTLNKIERVMNEESC